MLSISLSKIPTVASTRTHHVARQISVRTRRVPAAPKREHKQCVFIIINVTLIRSCGSSSCFPPSAFSHSSFSSRLFSSPRTLSSALSLSGWRIARGLADPLFQFGDTRGSRIGNERPSLWANVSPRCSLSGRLTRLRFVRAFASTLSWRESGERRDRDDCINPLLRLSVDRNNPECAPRV